MTAWEAKSFWWLAAMLSPYVGLSLGWLLAITAPRNSNDWLGGALMLRLFGATALGFLCSVCFTIISIRKREKHAAWASWGWLVIFFAVVVFWSQA